MDRRRVPGGQERGGRAAVAVATELRAGNPLFSNILLPVYVSLMLWGGLYLRDDRVRVLNAFRGDR